MVTKYFWSYNPKITIFGRASPVACRQGKRWDNLSRGPGPNRALRSRASKEPNRPGPRSGQAVLWAWASRRTRALCLTDSSPGLNEALVSCPWKTGVTTLVLWKTEALLPSLWKTGAHVSVLGPYRASRNSGPSFRAFQNVGPSFRASDKLSRFL